MTTSFLDLASVAGDRPQGDKVANGSGFGESFTPHMVHARWTRAEGWSDLRLRPHAPLQLSPAASVLHYAQGVFEGLKAFRHPDGSIWLFRPEFNARRLRESARRLVLPTLGIECFVRSLEMLVCADRWSVPEHAHGGSLYLRPLLFGNDPHLGVSPAERAEYLVVASPAGPYFADAQEGVALWLTTEYARAVNGGTGAAKCSGNYGGTLLPQVEARALGCDQVLYTVEHDGARYVDECGTMNLFVLTNTGRLVTPPLGTILDGATRDSVKRLASSHHIPVEEQLIGLDWFLDGLHGGDITEVFATGTAASVVPVTGIVHGDSTLAVGGGRPGPVTAMLRGHLHDIQNGSLPDTFKWLWPVPVGER